MREILFRGKATSEARDGEWVYGSLLAESPNTFPIIARDYDNDEDWISVIEWDTVEPQTIGQFTGLTDKNGKRIFEGDIVKNEYEKGHYQYFKIFYCNRTYMWQGENKYGMLSKVYQMLGTLEVIGNIHDNPELLERSENGKQRRNLF